MGWVVTKAKTKKQNDPTLGVWSGYIIMTMCTHKGQYSTTRPIDKCVLTMSMISGPHCQIEALHWHHISSGGFTWSEKHSGESDV